MMTSLLAFVGNIPLLVVLVILLVFAGIAAVIHKLLFHGDNSWVAVVISIALAFGLIQILKKLDLW
jgi:predicted membrane channel-forming protein YqfA (hemolysin III family)